MPIYLICFADSAETKQKRDYTVDSQKNLTNKPITRINIKTSAELLSNLATQPMIQNFLWTKFKTVNNCSSTNNFMCNLFKGLFNASSLTG